VAYTTLADVKEYLSIPTATTADDDLITDLIAAAQAAIDAHCQDTFEAAADTDVTFDAVRDVDGYTLHFGRHTFASITGITNGDDAVVKATDYVTEPRNATPYFAVRLLSSSGVSWTYTNDPEDAITVTGKRAYSTSAPADIAHACKRLVAWMYRQRENRTGDDDRALVAGNATILPSQIPSDILVLLQPYRRLV